MFKIFKRVDKLEQKATSNSQRIFMLSDGFGDFKTKLQALEDYLNIEFFHGDKSKPHYRKRRVVVKKLGRPRKIK